MAYTPATVKDLLRLGGNLIITGSYTPASLKDFARLAKSNNTMLTIRANSLTPATLKDLIRIGQDCITIEV
jgi:hypothetical protein